MAENLRDADDGKVSRVDDDVASGRAHALSAGTEELERRSLPTQHFNQLRAIHFARSFTGGNQNLHGNYCSGG